VYHCLLLLLLGCLLLLLHAGLLLLGLLSKHLLLLLLPQVATIVAHMVLSPASGCLKLRRCGSMYHCTLLLLKWRLQGQHQLNQRLALSY
jgi:hypothetical protein